MRPTSQHTRLWRDSSIQKRYMESRGLLVAYFTAAPADRTPSTRARASFSLRDIAMLRPTIDSTAPASAVDLRVGKHALTLGFQTFEERDAYLRLWVNGAPPTALSDELRLQFTDRAMAAEMTRLEGRQPSYPKALPIPGSGEIVQLFLHGQHSQQLQTLHSSA